MSFIPPPTPATPISSRGSKSLILDQTLYLVVLSLWWFWLPEICTAGGKTPSAKVRLYWCLSWTTAHQSCDLGQLTPGSKFPSLWNGEISVSNPQACSHRPHILSSACYVPVPIIDAGDAAASGQANIWALGGGSLTPKATYLARVK